VENVSLMRGDYYVWSDGESMHIWTKEEPVLAGGEYDPAYRSSVRIPLEKWREIVQRWNEREGA
jgi:hypothetical protein